MIGPLTRQLLASTFDLIGGDPEFLRGRNARLPFVCIGVGHQPELHWTEINRAQFVAFARGGYE